MIKNILLVLKKAGIWVFIFSVLYTYSDQWLSNAIQDILRSPNGLSKAIWIYGPTSLFLGLSYPLICSLFIISALIDAHPIEFLKNHLPQLFIELMRSWGKIMLWSLLFVLPAIFKILQYSFVPFVVLLDPDYQKGNVDALQKSSELTKGNKLKIASVFFVFSVIIPLTLTGFFDEYRTLKNTPLFGSALIAIDSLVLILSTLFLYKIYLTTHSKKQREIL